ncbi:MAG: hypothetical protein ACRD04_13200 [Terriglobales bacterium]
MWEWLQQRRILVEQLSAELRTGFQAVAAFRATDYLDSVERQEALAQQIVVHDRRMPSITGRRADQLRAAAELRRMNAELRRLADIQSALIEIGSRSVRCFQRVWALGEATYQVGTGDKRPPAGETPAGAAPHVKEG